MLLSDNVYGWLCFLFADSRNEPTPPQVQKMLSHDSSPQAAYVTFIRYSTVQ